MVLTEVDGGSVSQNQLSVMGLFGSIECLCFEK